AIPSPPMPATPPTASVWCWRSAPSPRAKSKKLTKKMVKIQLEYQGGLHCAAIHGPSGATLETDAPVDNNGRGESFSPTDLVATALGSCMLTIMGIVAQRKELPMEGAKV